MSENSKKDKKEINFKIEKWVYHATGRNTCKACYANDGKEFKTLKEAPTIPVHPNCNCWLEDVPAKDVNYSLSAWGYTFLKKWEGNIESQTRTGSYRDGIFYIYKDTDGNDTIGYGHLVKLGEKFDKGITEKQAQTLLEKDVSERTGQVNFLLTNPYLTGRQADTFISLLFNVGYGNVLGTTTLDLINQGKNKDERGQSLEEHWKEFRNSGGKREAGLVNRRADEWAEGGWSGFGR